MITKYIESRFEVGEVFTSAVKTANWQPERYVPPEIEDFVRSLQPDPRFSYFHLIAMTDGDWYGQNLNGDIFDENELLGIQTPEEAAKNPGEMRGVQQPRYKTFLQARFYRKHRNRPESPFYGDMPCVAWNSPMRRVEVIVRIALENIPELNMQKAPDIVLKFDKRGLIAVSMGCQIEHETCTYCGRSNELVKDRCPHLKNQMGQVMPNGIKVGARNYGMRFFDLSDVDIPADDTALSLAKVATAVAEPNPAFDASELPAKLSWRNKWADLRKKLVFCSLGDVTPKDKRKTAAVEVPSFSQVELDGMLKFANLDTILSTAAAAGIVFSPPELVYLTKTASADDDFDGFDSISLDRFSVPVYHSFRSKIAARSCFVAPCQATGWEPAKIAEQGFQEVADYYHFYRDSLNHLPKAVFIKAAMRIGPLQGLHGGDLGKIEAAAHGLVHAGLAGDA